MPRNPEIPEIEDTEPLEPEDASDVAPRDSEVDFDDDQGDDQAPLDEVEARQAGVLLDPETLATDDG